MKQFIYVLRDKSLDFYGNPMFAPIPPEEIPDQYRRMIAYDVDKCKAEHLNFKTVYFLGTYDEKTGKFDLVEQRELLELAPLFPKEAN